MFSETVKIFAWNDARAFRAQKGTNFPGRYHKMQ